MNSLTFLGVRRQLYVCYEAFLMKVVTAMLLRALLGPLWDRECGTG